MYVYTSHDSWIIIILALQTTDNISSEKFKFAKWEQISQPTMNSKLVRTHHTFDIMFLGMK